MTAQARVDRVRASAAAAVRQVAALEGSCGDLLARLDAEAQQRKVQPQRPLLRSSGGLSKGMDTTLI